MDGRDHPRRHVVAAVITVVDSPGVETSPLEVGDDEVAHDRAAGPSRASFPSMGYQPSLDGLRALSVAVVLLYHAGFSWMHGGFFGVEVFFVVSGFLITSLLIDEHDRNDRIAFAKFWNRRARRLFPALYAVLLFVGVWAALAGTAEQQSQLRRDTVWSIFYVNNWGQILGDVPYFAGEVPLLRHLWSLAVEEQWYLIWPLLFVALMRLRLSRRVVGAIVVGAAFAVFVYMFWMQSRSADAARWATGDSRRGRSYQLPLPLHDHTIRRPPARRRRCVRLATLALEARGRCARRSTARPARSCGGGSDRLCGRGRIDHGGLRLPMVVAARFDPLARGRDGRRPSIVGRLPADHELDAARRGRQAQLRPVPVELADLRDRRRHHRFGVGVPVGDVPDGHRR